MKKDLREKLRVSYGEKRGIIRARLDEFRQIYCDADDGRIFEELAFCICTAGASAKMGLRSIDALRDILLEGNLRKFRKRLEGVHRFPNYRPAYIIHTREYLRREHGLRLRELIESFHDPLERRDFFARNKDIKGIGYKESSHFLRNIGYEGYAILDKHILNTLSELGVIASPKPPGTRDRYIEIEDSLRHFADEIGIPMDELDLLLWSEKTGEVLK
ncbi:MAG: DNA lyase [Candidatus Dadabacteria bacterium]|nr:MAG: DNA lyase [Candidatus Dadabacteria bacterium]